MHQDEQKFGYSMELLVFLCSVPTQPTFPAIPSPLSLGAHLQHLVTGILCLLQGSQLCLPASCLHRTDSISYTEVALPSETPLVTCATP